MSGTGPYGPVGPPPPGGPTGPGGIYGPVGPPGTGTKGGGFDWNPVSWVSQAVDATASMVDTAVVWGWNQSWKVAGFTVKFLSLITAPVRHFVAVMVHVAEGLFVRLFTIAHRLISEVFTLVHHAIGLANGAVDWIHHSADWLANNLKSWGDGFYHNVVLPAIHDAKGAAQAVWNGLWSAVHAIQHWQKWLLDAIIAPIRHQLAHLGDTVLSALNAVLLSLYNVTIAQLVHNVEWLMKTVDGYAKVLTTDTLAALSVLKDAAWFLIKVGEYTPEVITGILSALEGMGKAALEPTPAMRATAESDLQRLFESML